MPDFLGTLTPFTSIKPISVVFKGADGNTRSTRFFPPADVTIVNAEVEAAVTALGALSNAGVIRWRAAGQQTAINPARYEWNDDLYSLQTVATLEFVGDDNESVINVSLPAPAVRHVSGLFLKSRTEDTAVDAMATAFETIFNGGAVTYTYAGGALPGAGAVRTIGTATDTTPA